MPTELLLLTQLWKAKEAWGHGELLVPNMKRGTVKKDSNSTCIAAFDVQVITSQRSCNKCLCTDRHLNGKDSSMGNILVKQDPSYGPYIKASHSTCCTGGALAALWVLGQQLYPPVTTWIGADGFQQFLEGITLAAPAEYTPVQPSLV